MSYENPHAIGTQVLNSLGYNVTAHGDLGATYDSLVNADIPLYAGKFYFPTETEQIADVKYKKIEIGYDKGLKNMSEAFEGIPLEAYIPQELAVMDTGSSGAPKVRESEIVIKNPAKEVVDEIVKAQREAAGREILIQDLEVEEIIIKRRIRKRTVSVKRDDRNMVPKRVNLK